MSSRKRAVPAKKALRPKKRSSASPTARGKGVRQRQTRPNGLQKSLRRVDPIAGWAAEIRRGLDRPAFRLDRDFLERVLPPIEKLGRYFDAEVRGFDNVPKKGPMLLVGNHSGGMWSPDTSALITAWYRERGLDDPLISLGFDAMFGVPKIRDFLRKIGQVPASPANAGRALDAGNAVLVYPGGDHEVYRPWSERNRIDFGRRTGFIKIALRKQVPVVPVVAHGGHDSLFVLTRGDRLAKALPLDRLRMRVCPILLSFPWGLSLALPPNIPLPAKVTVQICKPLDWSRYGRDAAKNPKIVRRCYEEITGAMQEVLTNLAREHPYPLLSRLRSLVW